MIDVRHLRVGALKHGEFGDLFLPRLASAERFLVGRANGTDVAIALEGEKPFYFAETETWKRTGMFVRDLTYEVDVASGVSAMNGSPPAGSLVLEGDRVGILGEGRRATTHLVLIHGENAELTREAVAFATWHVRPSRDHVERPPLFSYNALRK